MSSKDVYKVASKRKTIQQGDGRTSPTSFRLQRLLSTSSNTGEDDVFVTSNSEKEFNDLSRLTSMSVTSSESYQTTDSSSINKHWRNVAKMSPISQDSPASKVWIDVYDTDSNMPIELADNEEVCSNQSKDSRRISPLSGRSVVSSGLSMSAVCIDDTNASSCGSSPRHPSEMCLQELQQIMENEFPDEDQENEPTPKYSQYLAPSSVVKHNGRRYKIPSTESDSTSEKEHIEVSRESAMMDIEKMHNHQYSDINKEDPPESCEFENTENENPIDNQYMNCGITFVPDPEIVTPCNNIPQNPQALETFSLAKKILPAIGVISPSPTASFASSFVKSEGHPWMQRLSPLVCNSLNGSPTAYSTSSSTLSPLSGRHSSLSSVESGLGENRSPLPPLKVAPKLKRKNLLPPIYSNASGASSASSDSPCFVYANVNDIHYVKDEDFVQYKGARYVRENAQKSPIQSFEQAYYEKLNGEFAEQISPITYRPIEEKEILKPSPPKGSPSNRSRRASVRRRAFAKQKSSQESEVSEKTQSTEQRIEDIGYEQKLPGSHKKTRKQFVQKRTETDNFGESKRKTSRSQHTEKNGSKLAARKKSILEYSLSYEKGHPQEVEYNDSGKYQFDDGFSNECVQSIYQISDTKLQNRYRSRTLTNSTVAPKRKGQNSTSTSKTNRRYTAPTVGEKKYSLNDRYSPLSSASSENNNMPSDSESYNISPRSRRRKSTAIKKSSVVIRDGQKSSRSSIGGKRSVSSNCSSPRTQQDKLRKSSVRVEDGQFNTDIAAFNKSVGKKPRRKSTHSKLYSQNAHLRPETMVSENSSKSGEASNTGSVDVLPPTPDGSQLVDRRQQNQFSYEQNALAQYQPQLASHLPQIDKRQQTSQMPNIQNLNEEDLLLYKQAEQKHEETMWKVKKFLSGDQ